MEKQKNTLMALMSGFSVLMVFFTIGLVSTVKDGYAGEATICGILLVLSFFAVIVAACSIGEKLGVGRPTELSLGYPHSQGVSYRLHGQMTVGKKHYVVISKASDKADPPWLVEVPDPVPESENGLYHVVVDKLVELK